MGCLYIIIVFYSGNYQQAVKKLLVRSIKNTAVLGVVALDDLGCAGVVWVKRNGSA